jgi:uncharacterized repeat protein (TIGR02543 family)
MKPQTHIFRTLATAVSLIPVALLACFRSLVIVLVALGLSQFAHSAITMQSYWQLGEGAAIGTDSSNVNDGTINNFSNTTGTTILTSTPSGAAGSTAYAHTNGVNYQGLWMFGAGSTAQTVPADNWGVQFNVRVTTAPAAGTYKAVFGMAEGVSGGLVIEANNIGGTVYFDVNKQATANYIIPRNATVTVTNNTWYNLALVKSGGTTTFYVNGTFAGSNAGAINTSGLLAFGFEQNIGTHQLSGDFDEARFFTFAQGAFTTADLSMTKRTVTYDGSGYTGGSAPVDSGSYFPGTSVTVLGAGSLTRTGYVFTGWNTQAGGGGTSYSPAATFNIGDANTTLYAQWAAATATISAPATFPGVISTTYGTASSSTNIAVSGVNLVADITATAPDNLEVSTDNTTFGTTATFTQSGGSASGTLYVRLKHNAPVSASPYDSQSVILSSSGATPVTVATAASGNTVTAKVLTVPGATAQNKMQDGTTTGTVIGTLQTPEAFGSGNSSDGIPYIGDTLTVSAPGTFSNSAVGGPYPVTAGSFTLGGSLAGNYSLTQPTGLTLSASILNVGTWTQLAGGTWNSGANWLDGVIGIGTDNTADFGTLTLTANTAVTLDSSPTIGGLVFGDVGNTYNWTVNAGSPAGTLTLASATTPVVSVNSQATTLAAAWSSTNGLSKTGAGTLVLAANSIGAANLTANNGILKLAVSGLAYNNTGGVGQGGTLTVNSGATLQIDGAYNIGYQQAVNINGGTLDLSNNSTGDGANYTLKLNFTGGGSIISTTGSSLRWGELADATITVNGATPATISSILRMIPGNSRTGTINVVDAAGSLDFTGSIIDYPGIPGGVPLIKAGAGTLILAGSNSYTSTTTVNGGTLLVNGGTGISAVTVNSGATLAGSGTIGGAVNVQSGGTVAPGGNSIATLKVNNTLSLQSGSTTTMQIDKTGGVLTNDQLYVRTVNHDGALTVTATGEDLATGDSFMLFDATSRGGAFTAYTLPALTPGLSWDLSGLATNGNIMVVDTLPTPVFSPLAGGYIGEQNVTITCNEPETTIYYTFTTDGSAPPNPTTSSNSGTAGSSTASVNLPVDSIKSIKVIAVKAGSANSPVAQADYGTVVTPVWTYDGPGNWSDPLNWFRGAVAQGAGVQADLATLTLTSPGAVLLDGSRTIGSLNFGDGGDAFGWSLAAAGGSTLTLDNGASAPVISVANQAVSISAPLTGSQGLVKNGPSTLVLSGNNSYGGTTVQNGILIAGGSNALPTGQPIAISAGSALNVNSTGTQYNWYKFVSSTSIGAGGQLTLAGSATEIHNLTLAGGTLAGSTPDGNYGSWGFNTPTTVEPIVVTGGVTSTISASRFDSAWENPLTFQVDAGSTLDVTGIIGGNPGHGPFGVIKTGSGSAVLSATNAYTGTTTVNGGTLTLAASDVLANTTDVSIGAATLAAAAAISDTVGTLDPTATATINLGAGAALAFADSSVIDWTGGTLNIVGAFVSGSSLRFGISNAGLTPTQLGQISAAGIASFALDANGYLIDAAASSYSSWATTNGVPGQAANLDHDNDGVANGVEYFLGGPTGNTTGFTALPGVTNTGGNLSVTWTMAAGFTGTYGTDFVVESSETLTGTWVSEPISPAPGATVTITGKDVKYTFLVGTRKFARLKVIVP